MVEENIFQVMTEDEYGTPVLQNWYESNDEAEKNMAEFKTFWKDQHFWIEPGTEHIRTKCKGCGTVHAYEQSDAYGIPTGNWCDDCYNSDKYPYKKEKYDFEAYGERLEIDY